MCVHLSYSTWVTMFPTKDLDYPTNLHCQAWEASFRIIGHGVQETSKPHALLLLPLAAS